MIIVYVLLAIIAAILIIALFVKKEYSVQRDINIHQPKQVVFDHIKYLRNQDGFSVWAAIDPSMKKDYTGTDGTPGFTAAWDSTNKKAGKGSQTIVKVTDGERIDSRLHFIRPFEGKADAFMETTAMGADETHVVWGISSAMKYPMNIMLLFMNMDKMMGKDLADGLNNLKKILEK